MKFVLNARNLSKKYGTLNVLNSLDIKVAEKEIVAIVGPSGAGKTTLLHILGTLDRPENKPNVSLIVDGINTNELSEKELAKLRNQKIGFIFQFHELLPEFSALENVCIPAWISKANLKNTEKPMVLKVFSIVEKSSFLLIWDRFGSHFGTFLGPLWDPKSKNNGVLDPLQKRIEKTMKKRCLLAAPGGGESTHGPVWRRVPGTP